MKDSLKRDFKIALWVNIIYFKSLPISGIIVLISYISRSIRELSDAFFTGLIINEVIRQVTQNTYSMQSIFTIFFFAGATRVFFSFIDTIDRYHRRKLRYTARVNIRRNFYHKMQALKMRQLENTDMQNKIKRAREWMYDCEYIFQETMSLVSYIIAI